MSLTFNSTNITTNMFNSTNISTETFNGNNVYTSGPVYTWKYVGPTGGFCFIGDIPSGNCTILNQEVVVEVNGQCVRYVCSL